MKYRRDIDGLRAVAVVPVVLYHAGISWLSGGFVGVDVFFVISGYLITSIVAEEIKQGRFSILRFYERRARRILPALTVVILATLILGWFVLLPGEFKLLGQSALASSVFLSNVYFYLKLGYFLPIAEFAPLLHTWSLAVEEQFYIFFPPLLAFLITKGSVQNAVFVVGALSVLSLLLAVIYLPQYPSAVFYLIFFRAWELGIGALLALWRPAAPHRRWHREVIGCVGLGAIILPVFLYTSETDFPGLAAVPPVLGAALLIFIGSNGAVSATTNLLASRSFVGIGLLSYSLYLWHWPIIAFFKNIRVDLNMTPLLTAAALLLSVLFAWASYALVETPFRKFSSAKMTQGFILTSSALTIMILCLIGGFLHLSGGLPGRLPEKAVLAARVVNDMNPRRTECFGKIPGEDLCEIGFERSEPGPYDFLLLGDSHALAIMPGIESAARNQQKQGVFASFMGCLPISGLRYSKERPGCLALKEATLPFLQTRSDISLVIIAARWTGHVEGAPYPGGPDARYRPLQWIDQKDGQVVSANNARLLEAGLQDMVRAITETGRDVIIIGQAPEVGLHVPSVTARASWLGWPELTPLSRETHESWSGQTEEIFTRLSEQIPQLRFLSLSPLFCDTSECKMLDANGLPLFRDGNHVSASAAQLFLSDRLELIWENE